MPKSRSYQSEAIIIKKIKLGEADRILTFYTPKLGKIQGVAKGVRRPRSKLAGHLELLNYSQISLASGRNLDTITGSQTLDAFLPMRTDLWLTSCGLYIAELVSQFAADQDENESLFRLLQNTLQLLCREDNNVELLLRYFEIHLLNEVGYRPELKQCASCHAQFKPVTNFFSPPAGGVICPKCVKSRSLTYPISVNSLKVLRFLQDNSYETASKLKLNQGLFRELDELLSHYLEYLLERGVKSAAWLNVLREQAKQGELV
ncbi:DNA repair protein RecO [Chloroflexota bacterium]